MMEKVKVQPILDRFGVGRVVDGAMTPLGLMAQTTQGRFLVLDTGSDLYEARQVAAEEETRVSGMYPGAKLLLRADYTGANSPESSYAHVQDRYYRVYKVGE